jgi:hypothetical protein
LEHLSSGEVCRALGTLCLVTRLKGTQMGNLLNLEPLIVTRR